MQFGRTRWELLLVLLLLSATAAGQEPQGKRAAGGPGQRNAEAEKKGKSPDDPARRAVWFLRGRMVRGESPALLLQRAYKQRNEMREQRREQRLRQKLSPFTTSSEGVTGSAGSSGAPAASSPVQPMADPAWEALGPTIITGMGRFQDAAGRVTAVHIDQNDTTGNTVYIGGAYGGVWKTTNGTAAPGSVVWNAIYDTDEAAETLAVGAITVQPSNSNVILVGTGEAHNALDSYYGMGILRSTDGGATWELVSTADSGTRSFRGLGITRFAWGTANPNFAVASAAATSIGFSAGLFGLNPASNGLYWSDDAGATWNYALSIMDGGTATQVHRVTDVVYNATLGKFYAAMRWHGIYESSDGKNWTRMAAQPGTGLTTTTCTPTTNPACPFYRGQLAVRPGSAEMYASWVTSANPDAIGAIQRTLNGSTWTNITITGINSCGDPFGCGGLQGWYDQFLMAMPNKANGASTDVYFGTVNIYKCVVPASGTNLCNQASPSLNRWLNLTKVYGHFTQDSPCLNWTTIHPDQHAMDFLLADQNIAYFGNDGGVYRTLTSNNLVNSSCTGPVNPFQDLNNTSLGSLTQFISFSHHPTDVSVILGGTQDNGSPAFASGKTVGTQAFEANGGDGGYNEIDQTSPGNWYTAFTGVSVTKCTTGIDCIFPDGFSSIVAPGQLSGDEGAFYTPYILDPADQTKIIIGTCKVWRGPNTAAGWSAANRLSQNFETAGTETCTGNETRTVRSLAAGGTPVSGVSPIIYAGTDGGAGSGGGRIFVTTAGNVAASTWVDTTGSINPGGFPISSVTLDRTDATGQTAYITIMGFTGNPNGAGHVFRTTNAGGGWTDVGIGLPDSPADTIAIDPRDNDVLYVGTDVGVFVSLNGGGSWAEYGTGLPNVTPLAMRIFDNGTTQKLRIATHGRGIWQTDLAGLNDFSLEADESLVTVRKGDTASFDVTVRSSGTFAAPVNLSCVPDPPTTGTSCGISPDPADLTSVDSVDVDLDVPTDSGTTAFGDHVFNLRGDGGGIQHDLALTVRVNDFSISSPTAPPTIQHGDSANYTINVTGLGNFSSAVQLSCASFSVGGSSCSAFSINNFAPGTGTTSVTLTVSVGSDTGVGPVTFDVVAIGDGTPHSLNLSFTAALRQDFTFVSDDPGGWVIPGGSIDFDAVLTPRNAFSSAGITLSCPTSGPQFPVLPAGASCQFTPASPAIGGGVPQPLTIAVNTTTAIQPGNYGFHVVATDAATGRTHTLFQDFQVRDFSVAISPASRTIAPGAGTTYTVTVNGANTFFDTVTLGCNAPPANVACSFSPASVDLNGLAQSPTSTLTVLTTTSISTGAKTISVTGTAQGGIVKNAPNATLTVSTTTPTFTITTSTPTRMVSVGASTTFTLSVRSTTTTSPGAVTMSCAPPLPAGVGCSFNPASFTPTTTARTVTATVTTTAATPIASHPLNFPAATASQFKQAAGTLQVQDFTLDVAPNTKIIPVPGGGTAVYTVSLTSQNGFATSIPLSCAGLPPGASCGFVPASVTPSGAGATSTLTLTTTGTTPFGSSNFTVQGTGGGLTRSEQVEVINGTNDYFLSTAQSLVSVRPGQTASYSISAQRFGTFSAMVTFSCSPDPPATGTACGISPNPADLTSGAGTTETLDVTTNASTTAPGDYIFNFHGDGGGSQHDLPLTLRVTDFTIGSSTPQQIVEQTGTATYTVLVTAQNNFNSAVTLSCANLTTNNDGRLACSFSQNNFVPAGAGTSVTVTVNAAANADVGVGTFDVVATGGGTSHSVARDYNVILVQDFSYANNTGTQTVLPGQGADYSTTLTPLNSFAASIALSCSGLPTGASCSFTPVSPVPIASATAQGVTVTVQTASNTPAGNYTITVTGTGGGKTHAATLSLAVQSFTLSVAPASRTIPAGAGTMFSVTVNAQNGLTLPVTLNCVAPPAGITCIPPAAGVTPGTTATMLVQAAAGTTAGAKTVTIRGTTGLGVPLVNQNVTVSISSTAASFTLTTTTPTKIVSVGSSTTFTLSVRATTTTSPGLVTMSCVPPLPTGVACSFNTASFTPTTTARTVTATVTTTGATPVQSHGLQFQAASSSQFRRVNGTLQVADYTLGVAPLTRTISSASGGSTSYTVTLTSVGGFATSVALSCPALPAGWTCGFLPASVTPTGAGATSTLTLTTTNNPLGPTNFNIQGTGGGLTRSQQAEVINGQDFTLSAGSPITVNQGSSNTTTVGVTAIGTFADNVALSCVSPPAGISCGFSATPIAPGGSSTLTISATGAVAGGSYIVTVQGQSTTPALTHTANVTVNVPDFALSLGGASGNVMRGANLPLTGTATAIAGYSSSVTFSCSTGDVNVLCVAATPVTPTGAGAAVAVTLSPNGSAGTTSYTATLTGDDATGHVHSAGFGISVQDFAVAATDAATPSVEAGAASASYSGAVTGSNFTGNVALTCSSPSITVTCQFSPSATIAASGAGTAFTFTITPDAAAAVGGPYDVVVTGSAGGATRSATVHITVLATQDWSYSYQVATPQSQTVNAGQSASYNIDLTPNNGFASSVALTCAVTGAPAGMGCGITGSPVASGTGTITLNVTTTSGTVAAGTYSIVVTGTGGGKTRTTTPQLTVRDFSLNVTPPSQSVAPGGTADYTVSTATTSAFPDDATLSCAVPTSPTGTSCSFDAATLSPGGSTTMHVATTAATPPAGYTVQVTATSGVTVHAFNVTLTVANPNDFTITTSTPSQTAGHPGVTSFTVLVTAAGTFAESVTLSCVGQPAGATCFPGAAFVPSAAGTSRTISVNVSSSTVPGTYNFQIRGTSATKNHSVPVQLIIN